MHERGDSDTNDVRSARKNHLGLTLRAIARTRTIPWSWESAREFARGRCRWEDDRSRREDIGEYWRTLLRDDHWTIEGKRDVSRRAISSRILKGVPSWKIHDWSKTAVKLRGLEETKYTEAGRADRSWINSGIRVFIDLHRDGKYHWRKIFLRKCRGR